LGCALVETYGYKIWQTPTHTSRYCQPDDYLRLRIRAPTLMRKASYGWGPLGVKREAVASTGNQYSAVIVRRAASLSKRFQRSRTRQARSLSDPELGGATLDAHLRFI
ncbi:MAG TPA: hypothetical protein VN687_09545, partial [Blastocatellia bacterium]|nr:hypothetical protein [Blastocatellia bacterium]